VRGGDAMAALVGVAVEAICEVKTVVGVAVVVARGLHWHWCQIWQLWLQWQ